MRQALTLAATALLLAACGGSKEDQRVEGSSGGLEAPAVGAGGNVNGRGMNDSNATISGDSSGTGAPNSAGIANNGNATTSGAVGSGAAASSSPGNRPTTRPAAPAARA
jgi:hypothetical protein